jgi:sugar phosphate isomerase/epimerase
MQSPPAFLWRSSRYIRCTLRNALGSIPWLRRTICADELGTGIGIALDVYHVWWDPDLEREVERPGRERLLAFHICDWLVPTRDMLFDRGMMSEGVIDIPYIRQLVENTGYSGFCEVEILSKDWWKRPIGEVLRTCVVRYRTVC